jgi:hypothetical protein
MRAELANLRRLIRQRQNKREETEAERWRQENGLLFMFLPPFFCLNPMPIHSPIFCPPELRYQPSYFQQMVVVSCTSSSPPL